MSFIGTVLYIGILTLPQDAAHQAADLIVTGICTWENIILTAGSKNPQTGNKVISY